MLWRSMTLLLSFQRGIQEDIESLKRWRLIQEEVERSEMEIQIRRERERDCCPPPVSTQNLTPPTQPTICNSKHQIHALRFDFHAFRVHFPVFDDDADDDDDDVIVFFASASPIEAICLNFAMILGIWSAEMSRKSFEGCVYMRSVHRFC